MLKLYHLLDIFPIFPIYYLRSNSFSIQLQLKTGSFGKRCQNHLFTVQQVKKNKWFSK